MVFCLLSYVGLYNTLIHVRSAAGVVIVFGALIACTVLSTKSPIVPPFTALATPVEPNEINFTSALPAIFAGKPNKAVVPAAVGYNVAVAFPASDVPTVPLHEVNVPHILVPFAVPPSTAVPIAKDSVCTTPN